MVWQALGLGVLGGIGHHVGTAIGGYLSSRDGASPDVGGACSAEGGDCCDDCAVGAFVADLGPEIGGWYPVVGGYVEEAIYARRDKAIRRCREIYAKEAGPIPDYIGVSKVEKAKAKRDACIVAASAMAEREIAAHRASVQASADATKAAESRIDAAERVAREAQEMAAKAARAGKVAVSKNILRAARTVKSAVAPAPGEAPTATSTLLDAVRLLASMREIFAPSSGQAPAPAPSQSAAPGADPVLMLVGDLPVESGSEIDEFDSVLPYLGGSCSSGGCR